MSRRRKLSDSTPFDTLRLEGSLFVPELLEQAARGEATAQKDTDYAIPKGLKLHDEYGRAYRIATALWQDFAPRLLRTDVDPAAATQSFVLDLLRQCLSYTDLALLTEPITLSERGFPITAQTTSGHLPIIIAPHNLGLDDPDPRFAVVGAGAKKKSAHQLAQEFLNADRDSLWAIVTNGRSLRLLRDAETLTRPNFLEFDLETILREGEDRYADFSALWRILHASRSGTCHVPSSAPANCIWEKWKSEGHAQGQRVRAGLRAGVTQALLILGSGYLKHPDNNALRQRLHDGSLTTDACFQQLLRLIYRCLFLFCAEERGLLHAADSEPTARNAYATGYSLRRLRQRSLRHSAHDSHGDLWQAQTIVFRALANGQSRLALPALGGLFAETQCPDLDSAALANRDLLAAMRHLRWSSASGSLTAIDYRNMGPEELGSVYESLLELVPQLDLPARSFGFAGITDAGSTSGNARKTTGSYYTPDSLVQELIKSALDPVIASRLAAQPDRPIEALLSITVCDPSCGSGHFLLAAARRLAEKLAELRAPDGAVRPDDYRHALRQVASRCLYGVDINPMAVELCRVALWLETVDPGKPLGFLDHHIRTGNSLLGTTPDLIAAGLPDDTFTAIEGDDKAACAELKKRNKKEREGFGPLFQQEEQSIRDRLRQAATAIDDMDDSQADLLHQKEAAFATIETAPDYRHAKQLADLWCAAFVIKKHYPNSDVATPNPSPDTDHSKLSDQSYTSHSLNDLFGQTTTAQAPESTKKKQPKTKNPEQGAAWGITTQHLRDFVEGRTLPADLETEVHQLASQYRFFHWHLAFPQVFAQGGFDCILGNPPWEQVQIDPQEFFAALAPEIASIERRQHREAAIERLWKNAPDIVRRYEAAKEVMAGTQHYFHDSGRFPLATSGRINSAPLFLELSTGVAPNGTVGLIVPTGIATDSFTQHLFRGLVSSGRLHSLFDFENEEFLFQSVHHAMRFCLITLGAKRPIDAPVELSFFSRNVMDLQDSERRFSLNARDFALLNPNTNTCPVFRFARDVLILKQIVSRVPVLLDSNSGQNPWGFAGFLMFMMDAGLAVFIDSASASATERQPQSSEVANPRELLLPLLEGKMIHLFDHRFGTYLGQTEPQARQGKLPELSESDHQNPNLRTTSRYRVRRGVIEDRLAHRNHTGWHLGWRDITNAKNERTVISAIIPECAAGDTIPLAFVAAEHRVEIPSLLASLCSFVLDYAARQKVSGMHLRFNQMQQLPILPPATYAQPCLWSPDQPTLRDWILPRVLELTYTAWDLEAFATDCGWRGPPFRWDDERRFLLRCELDAAFFHLYLGPLSEWQQQPEALTRAFPTPRHAVSYIMDTFPIVKRKDEAKHGHYRTKETILQYYDEQALCVTEGRAFQNAALAFPPADVRVTHDPRLPTGLRPAFKSEDYFPLLLPLLTKLQPDGVEAGRLLHALEILSESESRRTALKGHTGDPWKTWATGFPKKHLFSDAAAALLHQLGNGTLIRWRDRVSFATDATFVDNEWLRTDAFIALRLAVAAPTAVVEHKMAETKKHFPVLFNLLLAAA